MCVPSISRAHYLFKAQREPGYVHIEKAGYITMNSEGFIELTESGMSIAEKIYERHQMLTEWLTALGVNPDTASQDACRMEHIISQETFEKIGEHIRKRSKSPED